jgi:hypothetical protein
MDISRTFPAREPSTPARSSPVTEVFGCVQFLSAREPNIGYVPRKWHSRRAYTGYRSAVTRACGQDDAVTFCYRTGKPLCARRVAVRRSPARSGAAVPAMQGHQAAARDADAERNELAIRNVTATIAEARTRMARGICASRAGRFTGSRGSPPAPPIIWIREPRATPPLTRERPQNPPPGRADSADVSLQLRSG